MSSAATSRQSIFEGENPYAVSQAATSDENPSPCVDLFGARARYLIAGRVIEIYWSHWTGWETYALDGQLVQGFRNWSLRHKLCLGVDADTGASIEVESSVMPSFQVRIWCGGRLVKVDQAPMKRAFDSGIAALLAVGVLAIAFLGSFLV